MSEIITPTSPAPVPAAPLWGLLAQFDSPGALLAAARQVRKAGYTKTDVYTPFPVHGMDQAMGLGRSKLGWVSAGGAVAGFITAVALQYYAVWDYPLIHQGKPYFAWQPYTIVIFELTVLFTAFATVSAIFFMNGLPQWYHPLLKRSAFANVMNDGFFLSIEAADAKYDALKTKELLQSLGAMLVEEVEE